MGCKRAERFDRDWIRTVLLTSGNVTYILYTSSPWMQPRATLNIYLNPNLSSFDIAFRSFSLSAAAFLPSVSLSVSNFPLLFPPSPTPVVEEVDGSVVAACFFASTKSLTCWISASVMGMSVGGLRIIFGRPPLQSYQGASCGAKFNVSRAIANTLRRHLSHLRLRGRVAADVEVSFWEDAVADRLRVAEPVIS